VKGSVKMNNIKKLFCLIGCALLSISMTACSSNHKDNSSSNDKINNYGNSSENIINGGEIAYQDGWYYYNNGKGIYKSKEDGTERTQLTQEDGKSLNVIDEWIYFSTDDGIRKIKTDGTEYTFMSPIGDELIIIEDWIYFFHIDDGLYKMKTDSTEQQKLLNGWAPTQINVDKNYIYYTFNGYDSDDENGIYRINKDGTENTLLYAPEDLSYMTDIEPIVLKDEWIYFYKKFKDNTGPRSLCRVKNDGSKTEIIYSFDNEDEYVHEFNILNNQFFWSSDTYLNDELDTYNMAYKISLDGKNKEEIGSEEIYIYSLNNKYIKKIEKNNLIKFEIYDNNNNQISTLE
jgi:hypothetical protein